MPSPFRQLAPAASVLALTATLALAPAAAADDAPAPVEPRSAAAFVDSIGVNTKLWQSDKTPYLRDYDRFEQLLADSGIKHIRDGVHKRKRQWQIDRFNELADRHDIRLKAGPHDWLGDGVEYFLEDMHAVRGALAVIGGPNEPDVFTGKETAKKLEAAGLLASEGDSFMDPEDMPDILKHNPDEVPYWVEPVRVWTAKLHAKVHDDPQLNHLPILALSYGRSHTPAMVGDLSDYFDYGAMHPYAGGKPAAWVLGEALDRHTPHFGGKPIMVTEVGYHTFIEQTGVGQPAVTFDGQAILTTKMLLEHFRRGIVRTYIHQFFDLSDRPTRGHRWGLVHADYTPKPAYHAIRNLLTLTRPATDEAFTLAPLSMELRPDAAEVARAKAALPDYAPADAPAFQTLLLQRGPNDYVLVLWRDVMVVGWRNIEDGSWHKQSEPYDLEPDPAVLHVAVTVPAAQRFKLHRLTGTPEPATPREADGPTVTVELGQDVTVLEIDVSTP